MGFPLRKLAVSTVLALTLVAPAAGAQGLSGLGATHMHGQPASQIQAHPSDAEVMAVWPAAARAKGLGGSAVMHCAADDAGALTDCQVMIERNHAGFGAALLSLAPKYRLKPAADGKRPDGADVVVTAVWPAPQTPVEWVTEPTDRDFSTTLTRAAWRAGGNGQAVMNCLVARMGALHDCMVVYQSPPGKGFGAMALRFQGFLRLKPATVDGKPIPSGEDIVFNFRPLRPGEVP
jgi:hypothetical protein